MGLYSRALVCVVILRTSPGGDVPTGYAVGDLARRRGLRTAVSGFCNSSCSRMFLGGEERLFTDDFPGSGIFGCEPIARSALDLGIITSLEIISSNDKRELQNRGAGERTEER